MESIYSQERDDEYRREIETRFQDRIIKYDSQRRVKLAIVMEASSREYWVVKFCGRQFDLELTFYKQFRGTKFCLPFRQCHSVTGTIFTKYEPRFVDLKRLRKEGTYKPNEEEKKKNFETFLEFLKGFLVLCEDWGNGAGFIDYADIHKNPSNIGFDVETKEFVFFEGGSSQEHWPDLASIGSNFLKSMVDGDKANMLVFRHIFPTKMMKQAFEQNNFTKTKKEKLDTVPRPPSPNCEKTLPIVETKVLF